MASKTGSDCKLYRNTATYGSPTWNELTTIRDFGRDGTMGQGDCSSRLSRIKRFLPTLAEITFSGDILSDQAVDDYDVLDAAFLAGTVIGFAMADGAIATTGTKYFRAEAFVSKWAPNQPLEGANTTSFSLTVAQSANADPTLVTV